MVVGGGPWVFRGSHYHSVDEKGRVIIPSRFRTELGSNFVVTKGMDRCLFVYKEEDFQEIEKKLMEQPSLGKHTMRLQRWFSGEALETQVDSQGRVALPTQLREFAGISEDVVITGNGKRIEIWSTESWKALSASITNEDLEESAEAVGLDTKL